MHLVVWACGKIERVPISAVAAVAEGDPPQAIDHDRLAALIFQLTEVLPAVEILGVQLAVAEVADDERVAEETEVRGRKR